jgi:hypothetical protein
MVAALACWPIESVLEPAVVAYFGRRKAVNQALQKGVVDWREEESGRRR